MSAKEIWKPVPGYGARYEASNLGRIRNKDRKMNVRPDCRYTIPGKILSTHTILAADGKHITKVHLVNDSGSQVACAVSRIVWAAFNGPLRPTQRLENINGKQDDNRLENLRIKRIDCVLPNPWYGRSGHVILRGGFHPSNKLTEAQVKEIRRMYAGGTRQMVLAKTFGVKWSTIHRVVKRKTWKHLPL